MLNVKEFIFKVRKYPLLYNNNKNIGENGRRHNNLWMQIAQETGLKNGTVAEHKWRQLTSKYVTYLIYGGSFAYAQEMQFMQTPLLIARSNENADADMELDENELTRIINADDESELTLRLAGNTVEGDVRLTNKLIDGKCKSAHELARPNANHTDSKMEDQPQTEFKKSYNSTAIPSGTLTSSANLTVSGETIDGEITTQPETPYHSTTSADIASNNNAVRTSCNPGNFSSLTSLELIFLGYAKVLERAPLPLQLQTKRKISDIMDAVELELFDTK